MRLLIDDGSSHAPHVSCEPRLDPAVPSWVPVAGVPGLHIEDPLLCLVRDGILISMQECVDAHICHQVDVVGMEEWQPPHQMVDPEKRKLWDF